VTGRGRIGVGLALAVGLAPMVGLGGCGRTPSPGSSAPSRNGAATVTAAPLLDTAVLVQVQARVLVDDRGYPLYVYAPDQHRAVTCAGECAVLWPPLFRARAARVTTGAGVRADLVGTDPDPVAGTVVTYNHWPLYTYAEDPQPGFATGQGLDVDGGYWYLMRPDGSPIVASR
jgi:predicted lipoprotein with Yx(FWY)xxD motif